MHEEEQERVPKINKKSLMLLQQRQERIEQKKLKEKMEKASFRRMSKTNTRTSRWVRFLSC